MVVKDDFSEFWRDYSKRLLAALKDSACALHDDNIKGFLNGEVIPERAMLDEMLPNSNQTDKVCILAHHCLPNDCDFSFSALMHPSDPKSCLSKEYLSEHECLKNEEPFAVNSICNKEYKI